MAGTYSFLGLFLALASGNNLWEVPAPSHQQFGAARGSWEPQCQYQLRHLQDGARITALLPPNIEGHWISTGCEVRPGPQFLIRSYRFYPERLFKALQFYYRDPHCRDPSHSLVIKGKVRLRQASWITRGAMEADYQLHKVGVSFHSQEMMSRVRAQMNRTCAGFVHTGRSWAPGRVYELVSTKLGRDCSGAIGFTMHELSLLRLERQYNPQHKGALVEKLFLGDIHTDESERVHYRPTGYQQPLQSALHHVHPCPACMEIYRADEHRPPVMPRPSHPPEHLIGQWVSGQCEVRPAVLFLTRYLTFHGDGHTWEGYYQHYADPLCRQPTFTLFASGHYRQGPRSERVAGGTDMVFRVTRARATPLSPAAVQMLNASGPGGCGAAGRWAVGEEQDITETGGCQALGIRLPHTEYELFKVEEDGGGGGRLLLYLGERPTDGSSPDSPNKRPTSYQPPLIQCAGAPPVPSLHSPLVDSVPSRAPNLHPHPALGSALALGALVLRLN
ncbi:protein APCDD1-like [Xenopus tropicalis]|uniref:Adenomatosis polyposis coli down-regulated 1-like n=2 Tax=Xenopus tropicalis TaxID=8364 RepID=A0A803JRP9_XENTR|nr:protein APCDD1-like [Xenopus tropicalis]